MSSITKCPPSVLPANVVKQYDAQAFLNGDVISGAPAILLSMMGSNKGASTLWIMLFDATTVPSSGTPILAPVPVGPNSVFSIDLNDGAGNALNGRHCTNGIAWVVSTTPATLTPDTTSSVWVSSRFAA